MNSMTRLVIELSGAAIASSLSASVMPSKRERIDATACWSLADVKAPLSGAEFATWRRARLGETFLSSLRFMVRFLFPVLKEIGEAAQDCGLSAGRPIPDGSFYA